MNLFGNIPAALPAEITEMLLRAGPLRIERTVSRGHASPPDFWYDQRQAEWVVLLAGAARLRINDESITLAPGDYVLIPPHRKHRVEWTTPDEPTIWLAVHFEAP